METSDRTKKARVVRSDAAWKAILDRYDRSGQSRAAFCRREGHSSSTSWFLATSLGNKLAGVVGGLWEQVDSLETIFWINGISALGAALLIFMMVPWIRRVLAAHERRTTSRLGSQRRPRPNPSPSGRGQAEIQGDDGPSLKRSAPGDGAVRERNEL